MFECHPRPPIPDLPPVSSELAGAPPNEGDKGLSRFIRDLELRGDDCADQLALVKNHLEVNGVVVTDVLVTAQQDKPGLLERIGIR